MGRERVIETYFLEHRARLLDIAAFLDRVDRAAPAPAAARGEETTEEGEDFRLAAFRRAIAILLETRPGRAQRIQELFSDSSSGMPQSARGMKGALGAAREGVR